MAQAPTTTVETREQRELREGERKDREAREQRERDKTDRLQAVVIDLAGRQSPKQVRRLRKGRGKLMRRIDQIVDDLAATGTVKAVAQPVIVIVRESVPVPWPFSAMADELDEDDDD